MSRQTERRAAIVEHGRRLQAIFPAAAEMDPLTLCRKLRRLEYRAARIATAYCNGEVSDATIDREGEIILLRVDGILGYRAARVPVFYNRDPRGYSLKIDDAWVREHNAVLQRDMGGYGIIAPDID